MIPDFVKQRELEGKGFDLYFAGTQCDLCEQWMLEKGSHRLQSQVNDRKNISKWISTGRKGKLFIDSGAYTALTQGKVVDVEEYIDYINSITDDINVFAQVDYIPRSAEDNTNTAESSWDNFLYMSSRVKEPNKLIPIYHQSENTKYLKRMVEYIRPDGSKIDYIGFGALAGTGITPKQKIDFFTKCYDIILSSNNPNVKVHAMGMTSLNILEMFPFYSADSTSWIMTGAMGNIYTPYGRVDVSEKNKYNPESIYNIPREQCNHIYEWLEMNDLSLSDIQNDYKQRMLCNLIYLQSWADNYKYKGGNYKPHKKLF